MTKRFKIPSTSALIAFESAARLGNFSGAADELCTSQSAVSRHIAELEQRLNTRLFDRRTSKGKTVALSESGRKLYHVVETGFSNIHSVITSISNNSVDTSLTIACTHEISHLFLLPRFEAFQEAVGSDVSIRIMTSEYEAFERALDPRVDVLFTYETDESDPAHCVAIFKDTITPVCAPVFLKEHASVLSNSPEQWSSLPFLKMSKENRGWANWEDWFEKMQLSFPQPNYRSFDNYVYLLEAAAAGRGLALGWNGLIDRHLETGTLGPAQNDYIQFDKTFFAVLAEKGKQHPKRAQCLSFLASAISMGSA